MDGQEINVQIPGGTLSELIDWADLLRAFIDPVPVHAPHAVRPDCFCAVSKAAVVSLLVQRAAHGNAVASPAVMAAEFNGLPHVHFSPPS
jgi:hypothetical protein